MPAAKAFERFLNQVDRRVNLLNGPEGAHVKQMLGVLTEEDFELPAGSIRGGLVYRKDVADYLEARERDRRNVGVYLTEARRRAEADDVSGAVRVLSSIIEEYPSRGDALRLVGYRLLDLQQPAQAARLFSQVQKQRPFEPHSYRDLAHALEESGQYGLAAINYEIVLAGTWHNRFRQELKVVALEEYAHMMQEAIRHKHVSNKLANLFGERLEQMAASATQERSARDDFVEHRCHRRRFVGDRAGRHQVLLSDTIAPVAAANCRRIRRRATVPSAIRSPRRSRAFTRSSSTTSGPIRTCSAAKRTSA